MQNLLIKAIGLFTFPNHLDGNPGSLLKANNVIINRDNIIESRRGMKLYGNTFGSSATYTAHQILTYKGVIHRHWGTGSGTTLEFDSDGTGTFLPFVLAFTGNTHTNTTVDNITSTSQLSSGMSVSGNGIVSGTTIASIVNNNTITLSIAATSTVVGVSLTFSSTISEATSGSRIKSIEQSGNLLFTTSSGIKKISVATSSALASATITPAGMLKGLDLQTTLNSTQGFFTQESVVSYRLVWGINDANKNLILGSPTGRAVIYNPLTYLLIQDFNKLLSNLDTLTVAAGIHAQNYLATFKTPINSPASTLRTNLIGLAAAIDNDVSSFTSIGSPTITTVGGVKFIQWTVNAAPTTIKVGDVVGVTGVSPTSFNSPLTPTPSYFTVSAVTSAPNTITYSMGSVDPGTYVSGTATIRRQNYSNITQPAVLSAVPTSAQLILLQNYYYITPSTNSTLAVDGIVALLQNELATVIGSSANFNGNVPTTSSTVNLTSTIPQGITTGHFYQIYRSAVFANTGPSALSTQDPGDELNLVFEGNPTNTDLNNGYISYQDITPDSFRANNSLLYTNPNSGEGIQNSNVAPPLAQDIVAYRGYTFYSNTQTKYSKQVNLLSVSKFVSGTSSLNITDGTTTNTYTFVKGLAETTSITTTTLPVLGGAGKYFTLNAGNSGTSYYIWYNVDSGNTDPAIAGKTGIQVDVAHTDSAAIVASKTLSALNLNNDFNISVSSNVLTVINTAVGMCSHAADVNTGYTISILTNGQGEDATNKKVLFSPILSGNIASISIASPTVITSAGHGLSTGQMVSISGSNSLPVADGSYFVTVTGANTFTIPLNVTGAGTAGTYTVNGSYTPSQQVDETARSLQRVIDKDLSGLSFCYYLSDTTTIPGQMNFEARNLGQNAFYFNVDNAGSTGIQFDPNLPVSGNTILSDNEVKPNRMYYSKFQQPEAVPIVNTLDIGAQDKKILRILALRDNLFVLKEEGVFRVSGFTAPFTVSLSDSSAILKAVDSAVVLNNLIYCYTTQGVTTISDTGVSVISRPIEDSLIKLSSPNYPNFATATFGVSYESDRSYYLYTVSNTTDTYATQLFRYNTFTNSWTQGDGTKRCGVVDVVDDKLYLGPTDINYIEQERKAFDRTDYSDREISTTIGSDAISGAVISLPSLSGISAGDVFTQVQYLTISEYNQLLSKLDTDSILSSKNYVSTIKALAGDALNTDLDTLITKISSDAGRTAIVGSTSSATYNALKPTPTSFSGMQTTFNSLITLLNADIGVGYKNFISSSGTSLQEIIINSVNTSNNSITVQYPYPIIQGIATIYNHINCQVVWAPQYMQDVSSSKQISEGTVIFEDSGYSSATVSYATDLSPNYEDIMFSGYGNGNFGNYVYGTGVFGGNGAGIPFRTYIPQQKQRCRYLNAKFTHSVARELFSIYGLSLSWNPMSQRAYR